MACACSWSARQLEDVSCLSDDCLDLRQQLTDLSNATDREKGA